MGSEIAGDGDEDMLAIVGIAPSPNCRTPGGEAGG
jgi:hypothetical protein